MLAGSLNGATPLSCDHHEQLPLGKAGRIEASSHGSRAGTGAAAPTPLMLGRRDADQEVRAAVRTDLLDGAGSSILSPGHGQFAFSNTGRLRSTYIAPRARGNEVVDVVIEAILVKVINDQAPGLPGDFRLAPVARMRSWSNVVIQNGAMLQNLAPLAGKGVSLASDNSIAIFGTCWIRGTAILASTRIRAELARIWSALRGIRSKLFATLNAVLHRHLLTLSQGGRPCLAVH
jgi:hypothetical protein